MSIGSEEVERAISGHICRCGSYQPQRSQQRLLCERVRDVDAVVSCAGNAAFKPLSDLTEADYELGLHSKLMGQVSVARAAKDQRREAT